MQTHKIIHSKSFTFLMQFKICIFDISDSPLNNKIFYYKSNITHLEASLFFSFRVLGRMLNGNSLTGVMSFIVRPNLSSSLPILHNLRGLGVKSFPSPFLALPLKPCKSILIQKNIPCTKTLVFNFVLFLLLQLNMVYDKITDT